MRRIFILGVLAVAGSLAHAQPQPGQQQLGQRISLQFKDSDITQIAEAVSQVTGKTFIIDPRVRAQVTMLSSTPMSPDDFYEAFLSILQVHGFVAVPAGKLVKIIPDANARQLAGDDLPDHVSSTSDEFVTQVVAVKSVPAAQLVQILRPLMAQTGHMAAHPGSNLLILSDRASNVNRLIRIIHRIDQEGDATVEVLPLQNASATEVARIVTSLYQQQGAEGSPQSFKLAADERSNSILISGEQEQRLRLKALITHLDTPMENGGDTQVRYLRYADAEKIAAKLKEQVTGVAQAAAAGGGGAAAQGPAANADKSVVLWADPETNALIITAPPKIMRSLMTIIDKLDIRRASVLVEAIIVEVSQDKSAELGVNWAAFDNSDDARTPVGGFLSPIGGGTLVDLVNGVGDPGKADPSKFLGTTIGIGRIKEAGINFGAMLRAIRGDSDNNVIATPSALTMDNQEAELKVAQEVPFVTGQYTNTGGNNNGNVNPFQTIQREEVGTILKVTPQISADDSNTVMLKIELESSNIAQSSQGAVDLITNKRTVNTSVMIEDGGIVVLGGLISDNATRGEQRVPFLGRIPIIGLAFKTRNGRSTKSNLMVFIRPKILRDGTQSALETNSKYRYMQEEQRKARFKEILPILPGVAQPKLPDLPPPPPVGSLPPAPTSTQEKEKAAQEAGANAQQQQNAPTNADAQQSAPAPKPPVQPPPPQRN